MYHGVNGRLTAKAGEGGKLLKILMEAAQGMQEVDGCLCYIVGQDAENTDDIWVYEVWKDAEAHQASLQLPVFGKLIEKARPLIAGMENLPGQIVYGGKVSKLG